MSDEKVPGQRKHHISVEQPDQEVVIDFLSFNPETGVRVPGATVKVKVVYDKTTGTATLEVHAEDEWDQTILFDDVKELHVENLDEDTEQEEEEDDDE